ncbi:secretogranin-1 [Carcharodon carcharias]|uniref:secretogranin-1 n=1 Tax=Carcharodon carcharias TaxID=13397 RepID=UPI001B7EB8A0|nr:secretogranin-1 [Carcharodon carcharias]
MPALETCRDIGDLYGRNERSSNRVAYVNGNGVGQESSGHDAEPPCLTRRLFNEPPVDAALSGDVRPLPVEREAQQDELVTRCIIEALSNALSKANAPPVTSECREILNGRKHEVAGKKNDRESQHYEEERHAAEESEKRHYEEKGRQEAEERHEGEHYEADKRKKDESKEQQHYKQTHDEERSEENNSEEDSRSTEDFKPVKTTHHVGGHRDHNSNQEYLNYEERRYAVVRSEEEEAEKHRKQRHSEEDSGQEENSSQKTDSFENTSNGYHQKWPHGYDKTSEESSEEDKAIGLHGHSKERRRSSEEMYSDREMDGPDEELNNQDKKNGIYDHKESDSEESKEGDSEEREKHLNGHIQYHKRNSYRHSEEARRSPQQDKKNSGKSDESSKELEHINNIRNYPKRNNIQEAYGKGKYYYEDKVNGHTRSNSEESEEEKQHYEKKTHSGEKVHYSEEKKPHGGEEEKRHHNRNTRRHSEEEDLEEEEEKKYHNEEKRHYSEEDKRHNHNEKWHQTEEDADEKYVSNEEDDGEERNTKHFPKVQRVWWQKRQRIEDRNTGSEEEAKHSMESHFYPEYEENDGKWEKRHYEKKHEEEDGGEKEEGNEEHALRQRFAHDYQEKKMYDRMDKLAQYLKSKKKSLEIPVLYDLEGDEKQYRKDEKRNMNHRTLTEEEEKELENLAAMDLELEKMAEKLHGSQRD